MTKTLIEIGATGDSCEGCECYRPYVACPFSDDSSMDEYTAWHEDGKRLPACLAAEVESAGKLEAQLVEMCGHVLRMFDLDDIYYMKAKARAILKELER